MPWCVMQCVGHFHAIFEVFLRPDLFPPKNKIDCAVRPISIVCVDIHYGPPHPHHFQPLRERKKGFIFTNTPSSGYCENRRRVLPSTNNGKEKTPAGGERKVPSLPAQGLQPPCPYCICVLLVKDLTTRVYLLVQAVKTDERTC